MLNATYLAIRRAVVLVVGVSVVLVGVVMLVTPGPAIIVIPAGLALLATEFLWARRLLTRLKESVRWNRDKATATGDAATTPADEQPPPPEDPARRRGRPGDA